KDDRDGCGGLLRRDCRGRPVRDQQCCRKPDQLRSKWRQAIRLTFGVAALERNIPAEDKALLLQSVQKPGPQRCVGLRRAVAQISDDRQARLRRGPQRRKRGRSAHQREELAAVHYSITSSARARIDGGTVRPSALAVFKLITSSNRVGCSTGRSAGLAPLR